ncbi:DUF742 domain-containing protein [Streptomyces sp. NBC_01218]|uniref:DUF742 domain-containing protein n=1 Tax=unclassified Streptomyces TaxID=2593676 RepID=UPI0023B88904|nr:MULTISPECIES: DUF742 domain-containing protein [unclassified Streptomyces]WEH39489.1 DUF742 domain-containing protein [Streptomyces sp. AM 2-1-1]WSQ51180.1 DUF742 domain-containing protein [Streptomyces sp. NBC_01218]
MAAPTGGHPYDGSQRVPDERGDDRFTFPSASAGEGGQQGHDPYFPPRRAAQPHPRGADWPQQPGPGWSQRRDTEWQPRQEPPQRYEAPAPRIQPVAQRPPGPAQPAPAAHNPLVRPYAMTGGRTRPRYQLAIEALVSTTADPSQLQGQLPEHQRICRLCLEIKSVAEISALLSIPLGVARILVADLAEAGLVAIHQPGGDETAGGQPDVTLLERVLSGLRKL